MCLGSHPQSIKIFSHTLDIIHRHRLDGVGRVWLLLRSIDLQGEGRLSLREIRWRLSHPDSFHKCLSAKRVQQLLRQGEGRFWHRCRQNRWLFLHSEPRVAATLGVRQIGGWAVEIEIAELLRPIREVRALFYDAFHSGRGESHGRPITRRSLQERGGVEGHTQRKYEKARGIDPQANYATLSKYSRPAWQRAQHEADEERVGGPAFLFIDFNGILGRNPQRMRRKKNQRHWHHIYIVRRIGNAYLGTLPTAKRGRRWTNRKLKHLCHSISPMGSFELPADGSNRRYYHSSEEEARRVHEQRVEQPLYHPWEVQPLEDDSQASHAGGASGYWVEWDRELPLGSVNQGKGDLFFS